ncbi:MAG TPA: 6-carboxytetrahydropterin synthase [Elusimicrobiota bacterium]|nr:6-carboxytetrahydropterin synthase [Elusimicrobiota bacterium]
MYRVTRRIDFCYGHRLMDYAGKCKNLHGHNGRLEVVIEKPALDRLGMVVDFDEIKSKLRTWVEAELDHKTLLYSRDPLLKILRDAGELVVAMDANPTAENIAALVYAEAKRRGLAVRSVRLWEAPNSVAEYEA